MKKNDELNGMINEMRDLHENRGRTPEKNRMEQSVIRRLVSGIRLGRIVIALLVVFIATALVVGVYWKFFRPYKIDGDGVTWVIGDFKVTTIVPDDEDETKSISHWVTYYDRLLREGYWFRIIELHEPLEGSMFIADVHDDNDRYLLFPGAEKPRNTCFRVYGSQVRATREIDALAKKMLSVKLWPAPLWKLRSVVKLLKDRKYSLISPGPYSGLTDASKLYFGDEYVYTLRGVNWASDFCTVNLTAWRDHFVVQPFLSSQFTLLGDESGYAAYQTEKLWGSYVNKDIVLSKKSLWMQSQFLELSPRSVSPDFSRSLSEIVDVLWRYGPNNLQSASQNEQRMMLKPWFWEGYESEMGKRRNMYWKTRPDLISCTIGGVDVSRPERYHARFTSGNTSLNIKDNYTSVGTYVDVKVNDEDRLKFHIRHEKPYPFLETTFDDETEALLAGAADIASAVLAEPASAWPEDRVPEPYLPYLESWLSAIASRRIVLESESHRIFIDSEIHWRGDDVAMVISFGEHDDTDMDVRFTPDGYELYLRASESLLTWEAGRAVLLQVRGSREEVLTSRETERLQALIAALDAVQKFETARVSPQSETSIEGNLDHGVPEGVIPGIEELRRFLADPDLPPVETVAELPELTWNYEAVSARTNFLFP